jgi:hypothetical protein
MSDMGTSVAKRAAMPPASQSSSTVVVSPQPGRMQIGLGIGFVTLVYLALIFFTKPIGWGDTIVYAVQISRYPQGTLSPREFWDFAHLFWRPLNYLFWHGSQSHWAQQFPKSAVVQIFAAMRVLNLFVDYLAVLAGFAVAWKMSRSVVAGALVAAAFFCWNPFVNFFQTGSAYVPGLGLLLAATYLLLQDSGPYSRARAWLIGVLLALSVCLWLPDVFAIPGILLLSYLWRDTATAPPTSEQKTRRVHWIAQVVLACAVVGFACYAFGTAVSGVRSAAEFKTWITEAGHGYNPQKKYFRVVTGLPRGLIDLDKTGIELKRLVLKDPYNPIGIRDVLHTSIWKLGVFYAGMAWLVWVLFRQQDGWMALLPFLVNAGVLLFLALVLFEPGAPERWMPGFPVMLAAVAFAFRGPKRLSARTIPLAAFLAVIAVNNLAAYATPGEPGADNTTVARMRALKPALRPNSIVALLSLNDGISGFFARFPFHPLNPLNDADAVQFYFLTEAGHASAQRWRQNFATHGLKAWADGGDIWISKRMLAQRPVLDWDWVEGDDPYLSWPQISQFFAPFALDGDVGGADGFVRIARVPQNQQRLQAALGRAAQEP